MPSNEPSERELRLPPIASDFAAREVLRVWARSGERQQFVLQPTWDDPAAWGLMLVDIARHVAKSYAQRGHRENEVLRRIHAAFVAEWEHPTDDPEQISD